MGVASHFGRLIAADGKAKGEEMTNIVRGTATILCLVLVLVSSALAQATREPSAERTVEERVLQLSERLRLSLAVASVAVYSPTLADIRLHAQQLVNLIEGIQGEHYVRPIKPLEEWPGMIPEVVVLALRFEAHPLEPETRAQAASALKNTRALLTFALNAALSVLSERQFERTALDMLRAYSYLAAAYETPSDAATVPALGTLLRILNVGQD